MNAEFYKTPQSSGQQLKNITLFRLLLIDKLKRQAHVNEPKVTRLSS